MIINLIIINNYKVIPNGITLVWVPLIIEHLNAITDCKFGRHDTEHYNK